MPKKPKPKSKPKRERGVKIVSTTKKGPSLERLRVGSEEIQEGMVALARGTDALVQRVVNSAREGSRDPAEHILDLSKAYYQEESSEGQHSVQCDRCTLKSPGASSRRAAIKIAEASGWVVTDSYDHCPVCRDGSKLLKSGSAALSTPPTLSPSDMILIVRLRYIGDYIERGASVDAFLQNSVRSGHRSMLSNLAGEFGYEVSGVYARIDALSKMNADIPEVFLGSTDGPFMKKLFAQLKAEDMPPGEPEVY